MAAGHVNVKVKLLISSLERERNDRMAGSAGHFRLSGRLSQDVRQTPARREARLRPNARREARAAVLKRTKLPVLAPPGQVNASNQL